MGDDEVSETESYSSFYEIIVSLASDTPVVGCEITPSVRTDRQNRIGLAAGIQPSLSFTWYREQVSCSVHHDELAAVQCMSCVELNIPVQESYHCSTSCFIDSWQRHLLHHRHVENVSKNSNRDQAVRKLRSCGSWPYFPIDLLSEGKVWINVGSSESYEPSLADYGFRLRLESVVIDSFTGNHLSPVNIIITHPVIFPPVRCTRRMIRIKNDESWDNVSEARCSNDVSFSVLSYNILSDLYARRDMYSYCPSWALAWEYRRVNLLSEIIEYDADIICLQEVQSNHFEDFFKPQLDNYGYSVVYKKKTKEVYTAHQFVIDGCATFYRRDVFKEIRKYELEFDKAASSLIETLVPELREQGRIRLMKDNIAIVVMLEALKKGSTGDFCHSRICVANTHLHASRMLPDVKLFQVTKLVDELEKITQSQVPVLICGDMNSVPQSDPHSFVVLGSVNPIHYRVDPFRIYPHLKLQHSLPLESAYASLFFSENVVARQVRKMDPVTREPEFTTFKPRFAGTLDYIFYTADSLRVEGLLELLDDESIGIGLPSPLWSSDHIALMATFRLTPPSHRVPPNSWHELDVEQGSTSLENCCQKDDNLVNSCTI